MVKALFLQLRLLESHHYKLYNLSVTNHQENSLKDRLKTQ